MTKKPPVNCSNKLGIWEQALDYLTLQIEKLGIIINFGAKSLEFKRLINSKFNQRNQKNQL